VGAVAVAAVVAVPAFAQVQSVSNFELEQLQLNPGARAGLAVGGADLLAPKDWRISASLGYQYAPLKYFESGRLKATLVDHRLTATLNGAASVLPWLELGATVPVVLTQHGESVLSRAGDMVVSGVPTSAALGTPWLHGRIAFFQERTGAPIDLGLTVMVGLPLGSGASLTRESSISGQLLLGAGRTVGPVRFAAEVGAHLREQVVLVEGSEAIGSRVLANAAVSTVGSKLRGELSLRTFMPLTKQPVSAEVLLGGRYAIGEWELFGLAGPGFGNAPGTPMFRAVLGASYGGQASARCGGRAHLAAECPELDFDGDGVANADDACPIEHAATSNGCATVVPPVSVIPPVEEVAVVEGGDEPPPPSQEEAPAPPALATLAAGRIELKGTVYFDSAKAVLQARSFPLLEEVAQLMKAHPEVKKITIEGHTDGRGDAAFNLKLSADRAAAVKTWLVNAGIDAERLDSKGYGLTKPIADNATLEGREKNRRVEFIVLE
jgi:OmpA-OmpF porin, OOP family